MRHHKISDELWDALCRISEHRAPYPGVCQVLSSFYALFFFEDLFKPEEYEVALGPRNYVFWMRELGENRYMERVQMRRYMALAFAYECAKSEGL